MFAKLFGILLISLVMACGSDEKPEPSNLDVEDVGQDVNESDVGEDVQEDAQDDVLPDEGVQDMEVEVFWVGGDEQTRSNCESTCLNYELTCQEGPVLTAVAALRAKYQGGTEILDDCMARPPQTTNDFSGNPVELESYECRCI